MHTARVVFRYTTSSECPRLPGPHAVSDVGSDGCTAMAARPAESIQRLVVLNALEGDGRDANLHLWPHRFVVFEVLREVAAWQPSEAGACACEAVSAEPQERFQCMRRGTDTHC